MRNKSEFIAKFGVLLAIEAIFCFVPFLGSLRAFGPIVMTTMHIPVIITAILLGTQAGTLMGFFAGVFSFIVWTFMPVDPFSAYLFTPFYSLGEYSGNIWSIAICFVPRILIGTMAGVSYQKFNKVKEDFRIGISALFGSLTNSIGVLGGVWLVFHSTLGGMQAAGIMVGTLIATNSIPEAILAWLIAVAVCRALGHNRGEDRE